MFDTLKLGLQWITAHNPRTAAFIYTSPTDYLHALFTQRSNIGRINLWSYRRHFAAMAARESVSLEKPSLHALASPISKMESCRDRRSNDAIAARISH